MVYFNVGGLCGETFAHTRVYQKAKYNLMKEGTSFKFSNLVTKEEKLIVFFQLPNDANKLFSFILWSYVMCFYINFAKNDVFFPKLCLEIDSNMYFRLF